MRLTRRRMVAALGGALAAAPGALAETAWPVTGSPAGTLRLAFLTDPHSRLDRGVPDALDRAAARIAAEAPDLVVAGGDLVENGSDDEWALYLGLVRRIGAEHHAVVGNRDLVGLVPRGAPSVADPAAGFRARLGLERTWRRIDALGWRIFLLDSVRPGGGRRGYDGWIGQEQMDWLRAELAATGPEMPLVIVSHMPMVSAHLTATHGLTVPPDLAVGNAPEVLRLFAGHNLALVLQGHVHVAEFMRTGGTAFVTGGAISANWWRGAHHGTEEGFAMLDLAPAHIAWRYVDYGWTPPTPK